jgi:hypothetical protein
MQTTSIFLLDTLLELLQTFHNGRLGSAPMGGTRQERESVVSLTLSC